MADQIDIPGPPGSVAFGTEVKALVGGNIVVTDPGYDYSRGAVYLYTSTGVLVSALLGGAAGDCIGSGGIVVLQNGAFVVSSPTWANGGATEAGAATWVDGAQGFVGQISAANSLVGDVAYSRVSSGGDLDPGVVVLGNGNYVVTSRDWNSGRGAVTWGDFNGGVTGVISASNSIVGLNEFDAIGSGGVTRIGFGNYVVTSPYWSGDTGTNAGAVTWVDGAASTHGVVNSGNSLVGSSMDAIGGYSTSWGPTVYALTNGSYVVRSQHWHNGLIVSAGAVTWGDGHGGLTGLVTTANSLVGDQAQDQIGTQVIPLANGNFVVLSANWHGSQQALTWGSGNSGVHGTVSTANSLVSPAGDADLTALSNGNYVVRSFGAAGALGYPLANATWVDGNAGLSGTIANVVTAANSFTGIVGVAALKNGSYVVSNPDWDDQAGHKTQVGAISLLSGILASSGTFTDQNSLIGGESAARIAAGGEYYRSPGVLPLANGNYVITGPHLMSVQDGTAATHGKILAATSFAITGPPDMLALATGGFVIFNANYQASPTQNSAIRWSGGYNTMTAANSAANALVGTEFAETDVFDDVRPIGNGDYIAITAYSQDIPGALTAGRGHGGLVGKVTLQNSVIGRVSPLNVPVVYDYDAIHDLLVVGQPLGNLFSLLRPDQLLHAGFD